MRGEFGAQLSSSVLNEEGWSGDEVDRALAASRSGADREGFRLLEVRLARFCTAAPLSFEKETFRISFCLVDSFAP